MFSMHGHSELFLCDAQALVVSAEEDKARRIANKDRVLSGKTVYVEMYMYTCSCTHQSFIRN